MAEDMVRIHTQLTANYPDTASVKSNPPPKWTDPSAYWAAGSSSRNLLHPATNSSRRREFA